MTSLIAAGMAKLKKLAAEILGDGRLFKEGQEDDKRAQYEPNKLNPTERLKDLT
jgi:hypothetical protein